MSPRVLALIPLLLCAQTPKEVRELGKEGSTAIPQLQEHLKSSDLEIRLEAVKAITSIGTQHSLDPLVAATRDNDPEIQIRATDGLVNFYQPGYLRTGLSATIRRVGTGIRGKFSDTNDQVIDTYVTVRPDVIDAIGKLTRGGASMEARANAARAIGVLRGQAALPDLFEALKTKDSVVLYECLIAFQKIRDQSAGAKVRYLLRDLDERVQIAAIETTGILLTREALPDLADVLNRPRSTEKVRRAALTAIAMIPDEQSRMLFGKYLYDRDEAMRAAAAEGFARVRNAADRPAMEKMFEGEGKPNPRLAAAFALVSLGKTEIAEFSPLQTLINTLNSKTRQGVAFAYLTELARDAGIRSALQSAAMTGTRDEKIYISRVLARSGDTASAAILEKLSHDSDGDVARESLRALQNLKARL